MYTWWEFGPEPTDTLPNSVRPILPPLLGNPLSLFPSKGIPPIRLGLLLPALAP